MGRLHKALYVARRRCLERKGAQGASSVLPRCRARLWILRSVCKGGNPGDVAVSPPTGSPRLDHPQAAVAKGMAADDFGYFGVAFFWVAFLAGGAFLVRVRSRSSAAL